MNGPLSTLTLRKPNPHGGSTYVYINNYKKWTLNQAIKIPPASTWSVNVVLLAANGTSAQTYTLYISAVRAPFVATTSK